MKKYSLNGIWDLYYFKQDSLNIKSPEDLKNSPVAFIKAKVPGNVELDLSNAGILPADLYKGENIRLLKDYEDCEWWYETSFDAPKEISGKNVSLLFSGVDCLAEYWLNNELIGTSENMFVPVELDVTDIIKSDEKNIITVRLRSVMREAYSMEYPSYSFINTCDNMNFDSLQIRKAPHSFGWDIMPRALTNGLWRDVDLVVKEEYDIKQLFCFFTEVSEKRAVMNIGFELDVQSADNMEIETIAKCGDCEFYNRAPFNFKGWKHYFEIENPKLWWPYGYGEQNLYDTQINFYKNGKKVSSANLKLGIRSICLERTNTTDGTNGNFEFIINDTPIMCKGANWVPIDAFHSRDKERYAAVLALAKDIGCNILRCWGGNVYEDHEFYDFCDENGIMVWQDFSMACHAYPQDEEFQKKIKEEAVSVIRQYRNHTSIILWSGDNECDESIFKKEGNPNDNVLTRNVLKRAVAENDNGRPYLPSSPYISQEIVDARDLSLLPEAHLWGPRDYYKSSFYTTSPCHFISETGYHGCPKRKSIEKFIDKEYVWPPYNNPQWNLHSTDMRGRDHRVLLMDKQIRQLFGNVPENLDDFAFASQVSQAEAKKFFIENVRLNRETKKGIIWWNLLDGWPQMSDAVVDYYFEKKMAFDYIKRSQQPFALMCTEINNWNISVVASNDSLQDKKGTYVVTDVETEKELLKGEFSVGPNSNDVLGKIPVFYSDKGMYCMRWTIDGKEFVNHYLYGMPAFELEDYKKWYNKIFS